MTEPTPNAGKKKEFVSTRFLDYARNDTKVLVWKEGIITTECCGK